MTKSRELKLSTEKLLVTSAKEDGMKPSKGPIRLGREPKSKLEALKEILQCVPDDQAKTLVDAYRRGEPIIESLIYRPELLRRGWTRAMFKKFLPEPVAERYGTTCWLLSCVEGIENTDEWKAASARAAARRAARNRNRDKAA
jgi:hypothetical protein